MKRHAKISAFVLSAVLLCGCAPAEVAPDVSPETSEEVAAVNSPKTPTAEAAEVISAEPQSVPAAGESGEAAASEEPAPPENAEPLPEELNEYQQAAKNILTGILTEPYDYQKNTLYGIDLLDITGDGVPELFIHTIRSAGAEGFLDIYDIAAGSERLATFDYRDYDLMVCADEDNNTHYVFRDELWLNMSGCAQFVAYFDLRYTDGGLEVSVPFYGYPIGWFEGGAHKFKNLVYKNCGYSHECPEDTECYHHNSVCHNFTGGELIGEFEIGNSLGYGHCLGEDDSDEIKQIIRENVFDGLTVLEVRTGTRTEMFSEENVDEMWDSVSYIFADIEM